MQNQITFDQNCCSYSTLKMIHTHIQKIQSIQQLSSFDHTFNVQQCKKNPNLLLELQCSICSRIMNDPVQLKCKHIFCQECIEKCLDQNKSCPLCRKKCRRYKGQYLTTKQSFQVRTIRNKIKSLTFSCVECNWSGKFSDFVFKYNQAPCVDMHDWFNSQKEMILTKLKRKQTKQQNSQSEKSYESQQESKKYQKKQKQYRLFDKLRNESKNCNQQILLLNNSKFDNQNIFIESKEENHRRHYQYMQSNEFKEHFRLNYYLII